VHEVAQTTGPLGGLPPADRRLLSAPPLELAVVEVRYLADGADIPPAVGLALRARLAELGFRFARLEQARQNRVSIDLSTDAQPSSHVEELALGWQLTAEDQNMHVTLMPASVTVQTTDYLRWSVSLRPALYAVLTAVEELRPPTLVQRVGLRYVDRFVERTVRGALGWHGRIDEHLLGPVLHPSIGPVTQQSQQQVELRLGENQGALLRHGAFVDPAAGGATSYILDIDVFDAEPQPFDADELARRAEQLNRTAASLFQASLTPEYLQSLQAEPDASTSTGNGEGVSA